MRLFHAIFMRIAIVFLTIFNINLSFAGKIKKENNLIDSHKNTYANLVDLSLTGLVDKEIVEKSQTVTYRVFLNNDFNSTATNIVVTDILPSGFIVENITVTLGNFQVNGNTITWTINEFLPNAIKPEIAIKGKFSDSGVYYNTAEITSQTQEDSDSFPNNNLFNEDDQIKLCNTVPFYYCPNANIEISASAPAGFTNYKWYKDNVLIANANTKDLIINGFGSYTYSYDESTTCPKTSCCPIIVKSQVQIPISLTIQNPTCFGGTNGTVTITGASIGSEFSIDNSIYNQNNVFSNLKSGNYKIDVRDNNQCVNTYNANITDPQNLQLTTSKVCSNELTNITLSASGGNGPYEYNINNGSFSTNNQFLNLTNGTYQIVVKDKNNCTVSKSETLNCTVLNDLSLASTVSKSGTNIGENVCFQLVLNNDNSTSLKNIQVKVSPLNLNNISFVAPAGTTFDPQSFIWTIPTVSNTISNVTLKICGDIVEAGVINFISEVISHDGQDIDSSPNNGIKNEDDYTSACTSIPFKYCVNSSIELQATAEDGFSSYKWFKNGVLIPGANSRIYTITSIGEYTFEVFDSRTNCGHSSCCPIVVQQFDVLSFSSTNLNPKCNNSNDGSININIIQGDFPISFSLNNGTYQSNTLFSNLSAGNYLIKIKDKNNCIIEGNTTLINPDEIKANTIISNVSCNGKNDGKITLDVVGGKFPYTFLWNNGNTTSTIDNLLAGTYSVIIKDANNCTKEINGLIVTEPSKLVAMIGSNSPVCQGSVINLTSGAGGISYSWSGPGSFTSSLQNPTISNSSLSNAGIYKVTITDISGCQATNTINVIVTELPLTPSISINGNQTICEKGNVNLIATGCSTGTIKWSNGLIGSSILVTNPGTYTAICEQNNCSSGASNSVIVSQGTAPSKPNISTDKTICCDGESATLTASNCSGTLTWSTGATTSSISVTVAGTYTATCSNACGSSTSSEAIVIRTGVRPTTPSIIANKTQVCGPDRATLTASNCNGTVTWNTGATGATIQVGAGTYTATCSTLCGTSPVSNTVTITQGTVPAAPSITANKTEVCGTDKATLTASNCSGTVTWSTGATGATLQVGAGTYTATCSNACGASPNSNSVTVTQGTAPNKPNISTDKTICCDGESATLTASNCNGTLTWSTGATTSSISVTVAGTYTATCSNACGSSTSSEPIVIRTGVRPTTPSIVGNKTEVCGTDRATLTASNCNGTVTWSTGATGASIQVGAGTYTATCSTICGTSPVSNTVTITQGTAPAAPSIAANKIEVCGTDKATLTASNCSGTVTWSTGATGATLQVGAGTYTATCSNSCGASVSSLPIIISLFNGQLTINGPSSVCLGSQFTLTAVGCTSNSVLWSNGSTGNSITLNIASSQTITAICSNSSSTGSLCDYPVGNITLQTTGGSNTPGSETKYLLLDGNRNILQINSSPSFTNVQSGNYTAVSISYLLPISGLQIGNNITTIIASCKSMKELAISVCNSTNGCSSTANFSINVIKLPTPPSITANKTEVCGTDKATLTASNCSGTLTWSTGATGATLQVGAGTYTATCSNACGASPNSNSVTITQGTAPSKPNISTDKTICCDGESATLTASNCSGTLTWSTGATTSSISVTVAGTYTATCSNSCGSSTSSEPILIRTGVKPTTPSIAANKTEVCGTDKATLTASNCNGTVTWSTGATGATIQVGAGTYTATCSTLCGTSPVSNTVTITQGTVPAAPSIAANKTEVCGTDKATLTASNCSGTVTWSTGATGATLQVGAGTYTATCSNACGASPNSNSVTVTQGTAPSKPNISTDKTICCDGESATLTASNCNGTLTWSTGATTSSISVTVAGTYTATCSNACGSSTSSEPIVIRTGVRPTTPSIVGNKTEVCGTDRATLTASNCNGTVTWSTGATGASIQVGAGTYTATCSTICGTSPVSNTVTITQGTAPAAPSIAANKIEVCGTDKATLTASNCSGTVTWSTGATGATLQVGAGTYTATCSNSCGASVSSLPIIISLFNGQLTINGPSSVCLGSQFTLTAVGCTSNSVLWSNGSTGNSITLNIASSQTITAICSNSSSTGSLCDYPVGNITLQTTGGSNTPGSETKYLLLDGNRNILQINSSPSFTNVQSGNYTAVSISYLLPISGLQIGNNITTIIASCKSMKELAISVCNSTNGCSSTANFSINVIKLPTPPSITANKTEVCGTDKATLTASNCSGTLTWSTGATGATLQVGAGTYTATCSNACGASPNSNSVTVTQGTAPSKPNISTDKTICCDGESATLTASNCSGTLTWSTGATTSSISVTVAGTYTATCSNACGSSTSSEPIVIRTGVRPTTPSIAAANKTEVCGTDRATLTASNCNGTVTWNTGATGAIIQVGAGTYTATCSTLCGTSPVSNTVTITQGPAPAAPSIAANNIEVCGTDKATLTASNCSGTVTWSTGATGATLQVGAGTYTATCSNACGASVNSNSVTVTQGTAPAKPVISTDKTICCDGESATLTASNCSGTLTWSTGATTSTISVTVAGTYTATCSNACGSSTSSEPIVIRTGVKPTTPSIVANRIEVCGTDKATLTASNCNGTVTWSTGATGASIQVGAGTYTATCSTICGTSPVSNTVTITQGTAPAAPSIAANKTEVCGTDRATLTASNCSGTVTWSTGATGATLQVGAGTYTATCSNACGASVNSNSVTVTQGTAPAKPVISTDKTICCDGESATLTVSNCSGILTWSTGATTSSISVTVAGTYTATCSNACGSSTSSEPIVIRTGVRPTTPSIVANRIEVCGTDKATLTASNCNGTVTWSTGATGASIQVGAGTYTATCSTLCGTSPVSNTVTITQGTATAAPSIASNKTEVCGTDKSTLTASNCNGTVTWSTGATGASIQVGAGTYTATCSTICGTSPVSNTVTITQGTAPTAPSIAANKTEVCGTDKATLTASNCSGTVTWNTGATGATLQVGAGTYTATCSNACGASVNSNSVTVTQGTAPAKPVISTDKTICCDGESATLTASNCSGTLTWSTGATTSTISVTVTGTYTATCSNACGSSTSSEPIVIRTGVKPTTPSIVANRTEVCGTDKATLTASNCNGTVTWSTGATGASIQVGAGTYTATCSTLCGTSPVSNTVTITQGTAPAAPSIAANKTEVCGTDRATLTASNCSGTVTWSTGATGATLQVGAGTYTATCSNACGASVNSNSVTVTQSTAPAKPVISTDKTICCDGESATLTASNCSGTLTWSTGATTSTISVTVAGTYTATCSNACGSSTSSEPIVIRTGVKPTTPSIVANRTEVCGTDKATLTASNCNGTVTWSTGATGATLQVGSGTYTATCSTLCGTSPVSNTVTITQGTAPAAPSIAANKTEVCGTDKATLTASNCSGTVTWSTGATGATLQVGAGTYTATCSNSCGASVNSNSVTITGGTAPAAPSIASNKTEVCGTDKATLTASNCSGTVTWSTGATGVTLQVGAGTYTAICSNSCGASPNSNSVTITLGTVPTAPSIAANKTEVCGTDKATLTASNCSGTVTWSTGATGATLQVGAGTYTATCSNSCGASPNSNSVTITGGTAPAALSIAANKTEVCGTDKATLTASNCSGTVTWSTGATGATIQVGVGTYTATCSNACGASPNSNSVTITLGTVPTAPSIAANKTEVCGTDKATLTASNCSGTVTWSTGATGATLQVGAGTYTATCSNSCGASPNSNSVTITGGTAPAAPSIAANKTEVCGTDKATLTASNCSGTVTWSTGATGATLQVGEGTYTATCSNSCGASSNSNSVIITQGTAPATPSIAANKTEVCGTDKATLSASNCSGTVTWSTGATGATLQVGAGTYTATCSNSCGASPNSNSVTITGGTAPAAPIIAANKTEVCGTDKATLTASNCSGTLTWSTGATGATLQVGAGTYTATCSNSCGASSNSNSVTITQGTAPAAPSIAANKTEVCGTDKAMLTASNCSGTVTWSTGATGATLQVGAGTYTATCSNSCGASPNSNSVTITGGTAPAAPSIAANKTEVCGTDKATLTASNCSGTLTWSTGATGATLQVGAGTYTATCSNSCGASSNSNSVTITQGTAPAAPSIAANKTEVCGTDKAMLTASNCSGTVTWSTGATGATLQVGAGTYTATCSNSCGASPNSNSVTITGGTAPAAPSIAANKTEVCGTDKATLTASNCSGTVTWSTGATGATLQVGVGTYTATCSNSCGASPNSNSVTITQGTAPAAPVLTSAKTEICGTESILITATECAGTLTWSNNATTQSITVSQVGNYTAFCTNSCGESVLSNAIVITKGGTPNSPVITTDRLNVCGSEKAKLVALNCSGTVTWNTGAIGETIQVGAGNYTATCSNTCGTSPNSNTIKINLGGKPEAPIITASLTSICQNDSSKLSITNCDGTVNWSNGKVGSSIFVKQTGSYTATCTNDCGTSLVSNPSVIASGILPTAPTLSADKLLICLSDSSIITASGCTNGIKWSTNETTQSIKVKVAGTYTATCSNGCGTSVASSPIVISLKIDGCGGTDCNLTKPTVSANKTQICESSDVVLTATGCGTGEVIWSNGKTGASITVRPSVTTSYSAVCKVASCISPTSVPVSIVVGSPTIPTIVCSSELICPGASVTLRALECAGTVTWSTGFVGSELVATPTATTKYSAICKIGDCSSKSSDTLTVTVGLPNKPFVTCRDNTLCLGESTSLTANGCTGTILWNTGQTGQVLSIIPTAAGKYTYSAICKSNVGTCVSDTSNKIVLTVGAKLTTPNVIAEIKNSCPFETVDLNNGVVGSPASVGGSFEFHASNSPNSALITTIGSVIAGDYYVFERSALGCYSDAAKIKVKITDCGVNGIRPDSTKFVDLSVKITGNSATVPVGEKVNLKVVVKNMSINTAENVVARSIIPAGVEFVSVGSNATHNSGTISSSVPAITAGDSVVFTYVLKVVSPGKIINKAELFKVDQIDNKLSNNTSEYILNDPLLGNMLGLSKVTGEVKTIGTKQYEVPFTIYVSNIGGSNINKLQVQDNLESVFGGGAKILDDKITVTAEGGLVANPNYTGRGLNDNLLIDSLSNIKIGQKLAINFKVKVDLTNSTVTQFYNVAKGFINGDDKLSDYSTNGMAFDPDANGDPSDNNEPSPIDFNFTAEPEKKAIGVAKSIIEIKEYDELSYNVTYKVLVKNVGKVLIKNIQLTDSLAKVFPDSIKYTVEPGSVTVSKTSTLKVNPDYDGKLNNNLLLTDSTSKLEVGQQEMLTFTVKVFHLKNSGPYFNSVFAQGFVNGEEVSDLSNTGNEVIAEEDTPTVLRLPLTNVDRITIPAGFSPNGDDANDTFIVNSNGLTIESFEIYNRWGHLVYRIVEDEIEEGKIEWDGSSNQGLRLGGDDVPDGTYYYSVKIVNEVKVRTGFITIAR